MTSRPTGYEWCFQSQTNYIDIVLEILNLEGHPNRCIGSKVTKFILRGWVLPTGGVALGRGLRLQPAQQACFIDIIEVIISVMIVKIIYCPYYDSTQNIWSIIPLFLQEFPWALPLGTPSDKGGIFDRISLAFS